MKRGNTVHSVATDNGKVCHSNFLVVAFLDERHARNLILVAGVLLAKLLQVNVVHKKDELEMPG